MEAAAAMRFAVSDCGCGMRLVRSNLVAADVTQALAGFVVGVPYVNLIGAAILLLAPSAHPTGPAGNWSIARPSRVRSPR